MPLFLLCIVLIVCLFIFKLWNLANIIQSELVGSIAVPTLGLWNCMVVYNTTTIYSHYIRSDRLWQCQKSFRHLNSLDVRSTREFINKCACMIHRNRMPVQTSQAVQPVFWESLGISSPGRTPGVGVLIMRQLMCYENCDLFDVQWHKCAVAQIPFQVWGTNDKIINFSMDF